MNALQITCKWAASARLGYALGAVFDFFSPHYIPRACCWYLRAGVAQAF